MIPDLLTFTGIQIQIEPSEIDLYQRRQQTISQHQIRILRYLNKTKFDPSQRELLENFLFSESTRLEQTSVLFKRAEQFLREQGILRPATSMLSHLEFENTQPTHRVLVDAADLLKEMNEAGKRKLPEEAPTSFIPKTLRPLVEDGPAINKHAWECVLLSCVRDEIKSGNLAVKHSKRFGPFDPFFISTDQWQSTRDEFFRQSKLPQKGEDAAIYLTERLAVAYDQFLTTRPENSYAKVDGDRWHISVDSSEPLEEAEEVKRQELKDWLKKHQRQIRLPGEPVHLPAALHLAQAGGQVRQFTSETQRSALAIIVNAIANLDITKTWGEGKTSASDGQRFAFRRKVQWQTYSHKFRDFALEFYSFVADNYAPFYGVPIECNERDAPYVLDGVLYNETDLQLKEHYTDTHGYT